MSSLTNDTASLQQISFKLSGAAFCLAPLIGELLVEFINQLIFVFVSRPISSPSDPDMMTITTVESFAINKKSPQIVGLRRNATGSKR